MRNIGTRGWGLGTREVVSDQWSVISETNPPAKPVAKPSPYSLRPTAYSLCRDRRAISLTEVLISMFVLMIGLLGVAAMIPAGRHEILEGAKIDNATAVGRAAFRDLKIRGYLNPANWRDESGNAVFNGVSFSANSANTVRPTETPVVAFDPLGLATPATNPYDAAFPNSSSNPPTPPGVAVPRLTRLYPDFQILASGFPLQTADLSFRSNDDLLFSPSAGQDNPPEQSVYSAAGVKPYSQLNGNPPLKRASEGNYSWLATIVTEPTASALNSQLTVTVAVFYKRELSDAFMTERIGTILTPATVGFPGSGIGGGEIRFQHPTPPAGSQYKPLKPGQWVMLAGSMRVTNPTTADISYYRWYRVVAADVMTDSAGVVDPDPANNIFQNVTLAGPDWNIATGSSTQIWMFDNIVTVYEKNMRLEVE